MRLLPTRGVEMKTLFGLVNRREWRLNFGRLKIHYERRRKSEFWGRFGGGWNWELGFQASKTEIIINMLVASIRISWYKPKEETP